MLKVEVLGIDFLHDSHRATVRVVNGQGRTVVALNILEVYEAGTTRQQVIEAEVFDEVPTPVVTHYMVDVELGDYYTGNDNPDGPDDTLTGMAKSFTVKGNLHDVVEGF